MNRIITGLDLGSSNIRVATCMFSSPERLNLLALDNITSRGIAFGNIIDFERAFNDVKTILKKVEKKIGRRIKSVSIALSGSGLKGNVASGLVGLSKRPRQISQSDIDKCKKIAGLIQTPIDRQIIESSVHSYYINEGDRVTNPVGLYATKLSINIYVITAEMAKIKNLYNCIEHAGYILDNTVFCGNAIAEAVIQEEERKNTILLIDIGSHITNIALFEDGSCKHIDSIQKGTLELKDKSLLTAYFRNIKKTLPDYEISKIVITGGGGLKEGILENAEESLAIKCELGRVKSKWYSLSPSDSLLHASSLGLVSYEAKRLSSRHKHKNPFGHAGRFISDIFESYF